MFWLRNGKRLHGGTELLSISQFNGNISYIDKESKQLPNSSWYVSFAKERDSGYYTCVMNNSFGSVTTSVTLSVAKGKLVVILLLIVFMFMIAVMRMTMVTIKMIKVVVMMVIIMMNIILWLTKY